MQQTGNASPPKTPVSSSYQKESYLDRRKRMSQFSIGKDHGQLLERKQRRKTLPTYEIPDPFSSPDLLASLGFSKYGSVAQDIADLYAWKTRGRNLHVDAQRTLSNSSLYAQKSQEGMDVESLKFSNQQVKDHAPSGIDAVPFVIILDSDEEDNCAPHNISSSSQCVDARNSSTSFMVENHPEGTPKEEKEILHDAKAETDKDAWVVMNGILTEKEDHVTKFENDASTKEKAPQEGNESVSGANGIKKGKYDHMIDGGSRHQPESNDEIVTKKSNTSLDPKSLAGPTDIEEASHLPKFKDENAIENNTSVDEHEDVTENNASGEEQEGLADLIKIEESRGTFVGIEDYNILGKGNHTTSEDDNLEDLWKEMNLSLESSKDVSPSNDHQQHVTKDGYDCEHSFVVKDDIGQVCRICGIIDKFIDQIFEYQYKKAARPTKTYIYGTKDREPTNEVLHGMDSIEHGMEVANVSAHPRHMKHMKPHQVEGFNFLLQNLVADKPGGCILAHAPGSGKTFMIITFLQSFQAKYPNARPLVILPKGILATWKNEFRKWQVEDIPLFDFYSAKADTRSQQFDVLMRWVKEKSILFLGYKQFSTIVCRTESCELTAACQEMLLKTPSILILDEGHTPRNEDTDVLHSLAKIQTPRKVVLSGTLYQNHVKEVFNILNLVRPKFLKLDTSRALVKRIMSKVDMSNVRKQTKSGSGSIFYDTVESTLQDEDMKRKVSLIRDLREMTSKVLHYYKGDFLEDLPGLSEFTVFLNLSPIQIPEAAKLKKLDKFKRNSVGSVLYIHPGLKTFMGKNPLGGGKRMDELSIKKKSMDELLEKLNVGDGVKAKFFINMLGLCESAGEKLLVFSQYLPPLIFLERLAMKVKGWIPGKETFMITGDSSYELRESSMEHFNSSRHAKVFFGSIKACGEGISLVGASRVLILDVHVNPSVTRQAIGRAFRPGQTRKVYTYMLVAADSPEEEDYFTCFRKETISKMWFEWNEYCDHRKFEMVAIDVNACDDAFLESPFLVQDIKTLYRR